MKSADCAEVSRVFFFGRFLAWSNKQQLEHEALVGGFNPFEKYESKGSSPQVGVEVKKYLKVPPPRQTSVHPQKPPAQVDSKITADPLHHRA